MEAVMVQKSIFLQWLLSDMLIVSYSSSGGNRPPRAGMYTTIGKILSRVHIQTASVEYCGRLTARGTVLIAGGAVGLQ